MKIIEGILDSGSGAELEEARAALKTAESDLVSKYGQGASTVLYAVLDIASVLGVGGVTVTILNRLISKTGTLTPDNKD